MLALLRGREGGKEEGRNYKPALEWSLDLLTFSFFSLEPFLCLAKSPAFRGKGGFILLGTFSLWIDG